MNTSLGICYPYSVENKISQMEKLICKETGLFRGKKDTRTVFPISELGE